METQEKKLKKGTDVELGGEVYTIPPLSLRQLRELGPLLSQIPTSESSNVSFEQVDIVAKVIHAGLSRNYPEITEENLLDILDMDNMLPALFAVMKVSGLKEAMRRSTSGQGEAKGSLGENSSQG